MLAVLDSIKEFIVMAFNFFVNQIQNTLALTRLLGDIASFPVRIQGFLPPVIFTSLCIIISVGIIKVILGWGNN